MTSAVVTRYRDTERRLWASLGVEPTEHQVPLGRVGTDVRVQEVGAGPPVLFVHGANTSGASWAGLAARMPGYRCLLQDRPGTGLSGTVTPPLDAASLPALADMLVADVLDALGIDTADVVATSLGGYVALRSAAAEPRRVRRLALLGWAAGTGDGHLPGFVRLSALPVVWRLAAAMPPTEQAVRAAFRRIGHGASLDDGRITPEDLDCYLALLRDTDTTRNELALGRALVSPVRGLDRIRLSDATLACVEAPTLLVWGTEDPFGGADAARRLAARLPDAQLQIVEGAGHAPWLNDPAGVATAITEFLRR